MGVLREAHAQGYARILSGQQRDGGLDGLQGCHHCSWSRVRDWPRVHVGAGQLRLVVLRVAESFCYFPYQQGVNCPGGSWRGV